MPHIVFFGRTWDQCSDMLPLSMICPIIVYVGALIPLALETYLPRDPECYVHPGHGWYRVSINVIFGIFVFQVALEIGTFFAGLIGTPLQPRKRWLAEWLLVGTYLNNIGQVGATIMGSWTLSTFRNVPCPEDHALKPLVIVSWTLLALSLFYFLICLEWIPSHQGGIEKWVRRLRFLCSIFACLGMQSALEPLRKMDKEEAEGEEGSRRETALMEHLAETFHIIFGDLDFSKSDRHIGLVLATALQQKRRHTHIKQCLMEGKEAKGIDEADRDKAENKYKTALEHCITKKHPTLICPSGYAQKIRPDLSPQEAADRYTGCLDRVQKNDLEEALGYFEYAVAAYYVEDQGLVATKEGKEEGKKEAEDAHGSAATAKPGLLVDRPTGDNPPPLDENLSNEPAPTFNEYSDPSSDAMDALSGPPVPPGPTGEKLESIAENEALENTLRRSLDNQLHGQSGSSGREMLTRIVEESGLLPENSESVTADDGFEAKSVHNGSNAATDPASDVSSSAVTPPWVDGVSKNAERKGEDPLRPTATWANSPRRSAELKDVDEAGNPITRIDVADDHADNGKAGDSGVKKGLSRLASKFSRDKSKDENGSSGNDERSATQKVDDKLGGMNKTAAKAMKGELQKGTNGKPGAIDTEDDKVKSSCYCFCQSEVPQATPLDKLDCIYSRAHNTIMGTLPYMIALDWERKTVVLGVRGTSSMSDALTDAIAQPIPIVPWLGMVMTEENGTIASVHSGILASAAALNHDLEDHGILSALFTGAAVDEQAKEQHTTDVPAQLDDKLVALLAETPAAAAFVDTHAIQSIPVTDIPSSALSMAPASSDILGTQSSMPQGTSLGDSGPLTQAALPSEISDTKIQPHARSETHPSYLRRSSEQGNSRAVRDESPGPNPFQARRDSEDTKLRPVSTEGAARGRPPLGSKDSSAMSPFANSSASPFSNEAFITRTESEDLSGTGSLSVAARAQSMFSSREMKSRDEDVIQNALNMRKAEQRRNQEAHDMAKISRRSPRHRKRPGHRGSIELQTVGSSFSMARAGSIFPRAGSMFPGKSKSGARRASTQKNISHRLAEQPDSATGSMNGTPLSPGVATPQARQASGTFQAPDVTRARSGMLHDAGRAMKKMYKDVRGSVDLRFSEDRAGSPTDHRRSQQLHRAHSKRVRFQNEEMKQQAREERQRLQREEKLKRLQKAREKKIQETLKKAEAQMQNTFMAKIFKSQQDLRKLDSLSSASDQAKRRQEFRMKQLKQLEERKLDCRGWQLVLTGHSLGAGVAALLALKLRPRMPNVPVKCWAFCPPGGLVTAGLAAAMEPFCTSVIVGKDAVPRASLGNLSRLVDEVVVGLARGKCCKARILLRNLSARGRAKCRRPSEYFPVDKIPEECQEYLDEYTEGVMKRVDAIGQATFPPGRIIYCRRLKETSTSSSFDSVWVKPEEVMKEGFIVSSRMLKDHLCDSVTEALEGSISQWEDREHPDKFRRESQRHEDSPDSSDEESDGE